jgi:hypothetical protein
MRQFAAPGLRLWSLSFEAKIIYTFFCALSLCAMASSVLLYEDLVGLGARNGAGHLARVGAYYGREARALPAGPAGPGQPGQPGQGQRAATEPGGGPEIALPEDAEAATLTVAMPYRKLLEITHFHLFTVPVFLLIISHLFMLSGIGARAKAVWIGCGWAAASLHIAAPWLVRAGPSWSFTYPLSGIGLLVSSLVLTLVPAVGMWRRPPPRRSGGRLAQAEEPA